VRLSGVDYHVVIYLDLHKLTVRRGRTLVVRTPIGVGRAVTPTPAGQYYITELLKQPDPTGTYGPYAFGMSVHSNVLHEFAGADGILGIHGTDFPQGIGTDVSHGCIRVSNAVITKLAGILPLGTPVLIVRRS
jgi:lipoprotein-anchoring transpeptidase ErfK/SrfK